MTDKEQPGKLVKLAAPDLVDAAPDFFSPEVDNPTFLHAVLCQVGLPRSRVDGRTFERTSGGASMLLEAGKYATAFGRWQDAPLPYGTKPRMLMFHICSEVVRTKQREIDLGGSVRKFLDRIGIGYGGRELRMFKDQSRALAAMHMTLTYARGPEHRSVVKTDPITRFDAWLTGDNLNAQGQLWPDELQVSHEFMETLLEHAVPLDPVALRTLQGSSLSLDIYTWLAHRLCRIRKDGGMTLYWFSLRGQFGSEYKSDKDFKKAFRKALHAALAVYPDARVEEVNGGLRLYPSPPPVKKLQTVVKLPAPTRPQSVSDIRLKSETYEAVPRVAPGWDKYHLEGLWREWVATKVGIPDDPDKAFIGWCRKFTKGKRPG